MSLWLANLAAVKNQPFRATSVHVTLTPPIITKTSRSNYAHIILLRVIPAKINSSNFCVSY